MMQDRGQFCEQNMLYFLGGAITKMAIKLSINGVDPYVIPYLKANVLRHAVKL